VQPGAALFEQDDFTAAFGVAELAGTGVGREINDGFADEGAAIGGEQDGIPEDDYRGGCK